MGDVLGNAMSDVPQKDNETTKAFYKLEALVNDLGMILEATEKQLSPILRAPAPLSTPNGEIAYTTPLASRVNEIANKIHGYIVGLSDMKDRLEI